MLLLLSQTFKKENNNLVLIKTLQTSVVQWKERWTSKPCVASSILARGTLLFRVFYFVWCNLRLNATIFIQSNNPTIFDLNRIKCCCFFLWHYFTILNGESVQLSDLATGMQLGTGFPSAPGFIPL